MISTTERYESVTIDHIEIAVDGALNQVGGVLLQVEIANEQVDEVDGRDEFRIVIQFIRDEYF